MSRSGRSSATSWPVTDIHVGSRMRGIDEPTVERLVGSIREIGLLNPISIRFGSMVVEGETETDVAILVAGRQRLEAVTRLGHDVVDVRVVECDEISARMFEISENLDRAELTKLERAEQISEWVRLCEQKQVSAQLAPKPQGGRPESGVNAASRELGLERTEVQRAVKIASISPEAKAAAQSAGLSNNQKALLKVADTDAGEQIKKVSELAARRDQPRLKLVHDREAADRAVLAREVKAFETALRRIPLLVLPQFADEVRVRLDLALNPEKAQQQQK